MTNDLRLYPFIPTPLVRLGIRQFARQRLKSLTQVRDQTQDAYKIALMNELSHSPIALSTEIANQQHYEVPTEFFQLVLGEHLKYSCSYWDDDTKNLQQAEENMLQLCCDRAQIRDGDTILDLGCGWGSTTLFIAEKYPNYRITAVSNSKAQKEYIDDEACARHLKNIQVITADMNDFNTNQQFHKIISIKMFEHMRNVKELLKRIRRWIRPEGLLFIHHFCHQQFIYYFSTDQEDNWMAKNFFQDGIMPSEDWLLFFQESFSIADRWRVNGNHYHKTCEAWNDNHIKNKRDIINLFKRTNGGDIKAAKLLWQYWQLFFLACSEYFAYNHGNEWFVNHTLMRPK